ncbi:methyltransferase domain-containing protein [Streptomyces specialis]|uniref:methyltransferase domain-containing protein n=1 Tax=Streptomyces specialis TaxID=498367 RepID=UPI00073F9894|nr:class I SAM-dependent methyltransferase [Streptomyces specialis]
MSPASARQVTAGYTQRAAFARAEPPPPPPALLPHLLSAIRHVAEAPAGAGHFLPAYTRAGAQVTLVDACQAMLTAAAQRAADSGLPPRALHLHHALLQDLQPLEGVDGLVVPNAAVNQLAAQSSLTQTLATLRALLPDGARLLIQALCTRPGPTADACAFYDSAWPDGTWRADRRLDPAKAAGALWRQRRQHHTGAGVVGIDFAYLDAAGTPLHTTSIELRLIPADALGAALRTAGFRARRVLPGSGGRMTEILATATGPTP